MNRLCAFKHFRPTEHVFVVPRLVLTPEPSHCAQIYHYLFVGFCILKWNVQTFIENSHLIILDLNQNEAD